MHGSVFALFSPSGTCDRPATLNSTCSTHRSSRRAQAPLQALPQRRLSTMAAPHTQRSSSSNAPKKQPRPNALPLRAAAAAAAAVAPEPAAAAAVLRANPTVAALQQPLHAAAGKDAVPVVPLKRAPRRRGTR